MKKSKLISKTKIVLFDVLQFCFCTDSLQFIFVILIKIHFENKIKLKSAYIK